MDKCAIEILQLVFTLLPQNQISTCSLVCRSWYLAARDPLYHSIHFYSLDRVLAFINLTPSSSTPIDEKDTSIIRYMKTIPRGFLVRKMTFHIQIKESCTWSALQATSPGVTSVDIIPENNHEPYGICRHRYRHPLALQWKWLKRLPVWHKDDYGLWKSLLSDQLIYLGLDVYFYDHLIISDNTVESSFNILNRNNNNLITKTLHLPPMQCLQELDLYASRHFFLIDERSFELIHAACPNLRTFSLTSFQMHTITTSGNSIYLPTNLTTLNLNRFCIHDLNTYIYLGHKYPNLNSLKVKEIRKGSLPHHDASVSDHRSAIFYLITNYFTKLTNINADLYELLDNNFSPSQSESIWPYNELQQWLSNDKQKKSSNITTLHWSCLLPFNTLVNDNDNDDYDEKITTSPELTLALSSFSNQFYFSHLTSLLMILPSNTSWQQIQQLWENQKNTTTPLLPLLTTLIIRHKLGDNRTYNNNGTSFPRQKNQDFFALTTTCPKLIRLEIENGLFVPEINWTRNNISFSLLKELVISNCLISLKKNVTDVCLKCPYLKRLSLNHVQCQLPPPISSYSDCNFIPTKESGHLFTLQIDIPFYSLDYIGLTSLWYVRMMDSDQRYTKRVAVDSVKVNQEIVTFDKSDMENYQRMHYFNTNMTQVSILVNCQYVAQTNVNLKKYT